MLTITKIWKMLKSPITQLELLSALENADNARLSVYLMPKQPDESYFFRFVGS